MAGWHHWLDGRESEWTLRVRDGQGGLACCDSWVAKSSTRLSDWTELNWTELNWTELNWLSYPQVQRFFPQWYLVYQWAQKTFFISATIFSISCIYFLFFLRIYISLLYYPSVLAYYLFFPLKSSASNDSFKEILGFIIPTFLPYLTDFDICSVSSHCIFYL